MTAPLRAKKKNRILTLALLGLLAISLVGFGVNSVGTGGARKVATVGDQAVTVDDYVQALNAQLRALSAQLGQQVTLETARALGLDRQVLAQLLAQAALDDEAARIGLSVGDAEVRKQILATPAFQDASGRFDQAAYRFALDNAGLKPAEYDEILRGNATRDLMRRAIAEGIAPGRLYALTLMAYLGETRDFTWAPIVAEMLDGPTREPTEDEIAAWYKANPEAYTAPEIRRITYVWITPEMLLPRLEASEDELRALYEKRKDRYDIPERRIVDRLVFPDADSARAAAQAIAAGEKTFAEVVGEQGLQLDDVALGEVSADDLSDEAAKAVFGLADNGVTGPVETDLGPALFRVNAILSARRTSFEDAREELRRELLMDTARRQIDADSRRADDLLAAGAELEEIAKETPMELGRIDYTKDTREGIAAYEEFRTEAERVTKQDFPAIKPLSDGGAFAVRLDEIVPPRLKELSEVRDQVIADWKRAETLKRRKELAARIAKELEAGKSFVDLELFLQVEKGRQRGSRVEGAPADLVARMFELDPGKATVVANDKVVVVARLDKVNPFDPETEENRAIVDSVTERLAGQIGNDLVTLFVAAAQDRAGVQVNQAVIDAVQAQIP